MSDELIYGEGDRDFHSPFDLGFDPAAIATIKWLVLGHLFYLVGLTIMLMANVSMGNVWVTPLYGVPLLWAGRKEREWARILVFVVGFTAVHYFAVQGAMRYYSGGDGGNISALLVPGLIGGAVGGAGALILCGVSRMFRPGAPTLVFALFGTLLMAGVGSIGVYMYLTTGAGGNSFGTELLRLLWIYTPWQLVFAYVLAKSLKPIGA